MMNFFQGDEQAPSGPASWWIVGISILYLGLYLHVALSRMAYPFELEWMEGCSVDHVLRVLAGDSLYTEPSIEFTGYIYTPLYFYASALASLAVGEGFLALRLVSFLASIGCFLALYLFVKRETAGGRLWGLLAAGFFAAAFPLSGGWYDIGRVDMLFMCFLLSAVYMMRSGDECRFQCAAGICMILAFLTKQTALVVAGFMILFALFRIRGAGRFVFPLTFIALLGIVHVVFQWRTEGWWRFYVFDLPAGHAVEKEMIFKGFWVNDLLAKTPVAAALTVFFLNHLRVQSRSRDFWFFFFLLTGMVAAAWMSRLHAGGFDNVLMPLYAVMSIFLAMGAHALTGPMGARRLSGAESAARNAPPLWRPYRFTLYLILGFQFVMPAYAPGGFIPDHQDRLSGERFIRILADVRGDVFVPWHGYVAAMAGKQTFAHLMPLADVLRGDRGEASEALRKDIRRAVGDRRFGAIVLDGPLLPFMEEINRHYVERGELFKEGDGFFPVAGMKTRPDRMFVPRPPGTTP